MTTYKAVKVSGARSSDLVAVFGIGGLGHLALQYARIAGASVVAVDIERREAAAGARAGRRARRERRASRTRSPRSRRWAVPTWRSSLAVSPSAMRAGVRLSRAAAVGWCCVALPARQRAGAPDLPDRAQGHQRDRLDRRHARDLTEVFELHAAGRTRVIAEGRKLDEVNSCFDQVLAGDVPARLVLEF